MTDKKVWVVSKALFPMEDPTNVGTSEKITRIEGQATQLVPRTSWVESQLRAGSLEAYDGNPEEGGKPLPAPAPAPAAAAAATGEAAGDAAAGDAAAGDAAAAAAAKTAAKK